ncbi:MAG: hypothetical protein HC810_07100 [Acaryochloridaceae cyanobacterium RL_2_7]|nr:hypothetical protein [Acaryochloridaceae cyanobacterium RL_2_7]
MITRLSDDYTIGVVRHSGDEPVVKEVAFARNPTIALTDGVTPIYQLGASPQLRWLITPIANQYSHQRWVRPLFNLLLQLSVKRNLIKISQYYDVIHGVYTGMTASIRIAQKIAKRQGKPFILTPLVHIDDPQKKAARSLRQLFLDSDRLIAMTSLEKNG